MGQMRIVPGAVTGIDMGVALAMGGALAVNPLVVAEWLPAIEARIVKAMRERSEG